MNRVPATVLWATLGGALWLTTTASLAAEANKPEGSEDAKAATQQRLEAAQRRLERAAQEVADLSMSLSEEEVVGAAARARFPQRAVLGVGIDTDEEEEERDEGVEIISVSPGGPAAEAGLKSGDVLLAVNNKELKRDDDGSARSKLLAVMRSTKPGEKVSIKYTRDGKTKAANVVTKSISTERGFAYGPRAGRFERFEIPGFSFNSILGNAELVPLTPKLGQYFGTEKGLLVVRAPAEHELELEDGDVILEIDGRAPSSTSHAMRILSSYQPGEKLTLTVMRKKRKNEIEVVVPEKAPRAGLERQIERSLRSLSALQPYRTGRGFRVPPPPALPLAPAPPPAAQLAPPPPPAAVEAPPIAVAPPAPPSIQIEPQSDAAPELY